GVPILSQPLDSKGNYSFVLLQAGNYRIEASAPGLVFNQQFVTVSGGTVKSGLKHTAGARSITGTVKNASNSALVAGAQVIVTNLGTDLVVTNAGSAVTGADGKFTVNGLLDGDYRVTVLANGFAMSVINDLPVEGSNPAPVTIALASSAALQGT